MLFDFFSSKHPEEAVSSKEFILLTLLVFLIFIIALKKQKLTLGGALSALSIGTLMSLAGFEYLLIMTAFFVSSTKATGLHKKIKEKHLGVAYKKDSKRNAYQVLAKGFLPTIISFIVYKNFGGKLKLFNPDLQSKTIKFLYGIFIGFFISANADTWASEIGIASKENPILITTFKRVPKGINGGVSSLGTIMSIIGGLFIGVVALLCSIIREFSIEEMVMLIKPKNLYIIFLMCLLGAVGGFFGSGVDSIIGATLQISIYDKNKGVVMNSDDMNEASIKAIRKEKDKFDVYGKDVFNNKQVNFIAGSITGCFCGIILVYFL